MTCKVLPYSLFISASLWSCFPAYNANPKEYRKAKAGFSRKKVYVVNRDLEKEFRILKRSEIYEIVEDSVQTAKIRLYPMKTYTPSCGNAMIGSMLTVGLLPSSFPHNISYSYDVIENDITKNYQFNLNITQSLWLFNIFRPGKRYARQSGKALLGNYISSNN